MSTASKAIGLFLLVGLSATVAACEGGEGTTNEVENPANEQVAPSEGGEGGEGGEG